MANGRPTGDGSDRSPAGRRGKAANQEGLAALGREMRTGSEGGSVANESGLRALGTRIDSQRAKPKGVRRSGKAKWSGRKKVVLSLCALVVLIAAVAGGGYAYLQYRYDQINKVHIDAEVAAANGGPFTILVIGSDSRVGEGTAYGSASVVTGQRSDVVQLWRVTPSTKQIQILSIPRDTVVSMLGSDVSQFGTYNRINSSYNSGANQLVQTITANFGIPINHVVQVDFAGFQDSVNALGGIYLNFAYPAKDAYSGLNITDARLSVAQRDPGPGGRSVAALLLLPGRRMAVRRDERLRAHPAPGRVPQSDDLGRQVQGESAHGQCLHRLHPRRRHHRRRVQPQRAHRSGAHLPLVRPEQPADADAADGLLRRLRGPG